MDVHNRCRLARRRARGKNLVAFAVSGAIFLLTGPVKLRLDLLEEHDALLGLVEEALEEDTCADDDELRE